MTEKKDAPKNKGGRPSAFTEERKEKILQALRAGNYRTAAAKWAGIEPGTLKAWVNRGNHGEPGYAEFVAAIKEAEGQAEASLVATIKKASQEHWQAAAWLLERKLYRKWCRKDAAKVEHTGANGGPVEFVRIERVVTDAKAAAR